MSGVITVRNSPGDWDWCVSMRHHGFIIALVVPVTRKDERRWEKKGSRGRTPCRNQYSYKYLLLRPVNTTLNKKQVLCCAGQSLGLFCDYFAIKAICHNSLMTTEIFKSCGSACSEPLHISFNLIRSN